MPWSHLFIKKSQKSIFKIRLLRGEWTILSVGFKLPSPGETIFEKSQSRRFPKTFSNFFCTNLCQTYYFMYTANSSEIIKFLTFVGLSWKDDLKLKYPEIHSIFECQFHPIKMIGHSIFLVSPTHIHANMSFIEKKCRKLIFSIPISRGELF